MPNQSGYDLLLRHSKSNESLDGDHAEAEEIFQLRRRRKYYRTALGVSTCIFLVSMLAVFIRGTHHDSTLLRSQRMFDSIPTIISTFNPDEHYQQGDPFASTTGPWIDLNPPGKGHIIVKDPRRWQLPPSWPVNKEHKDGAAEYTISMFHQLHCLASLKSAFEALTAFKEERPHVDSPHADRLHSNHLNHCFDYLRQAVMCAGDTSLEKSMHVNGELVRGVDGWGVQHQCRDFRWIFDYASEHGRSNETGIA